MVASKKGDGRRGKAVKANGSEAAVGAEAVIDEAEAEAEEEAEVAGKVDALGRPVVHIPEGRSKSGRVWKVKQTSRFSTIKRVGMMSHLCSTFDEKKARREKYDNMKTLEREMQQEKKAKAEDAKQRREEQLKRKAANEYKNSVFQVVKAETMKGMSKKQLRMIRKTAINKHGQVELVNPFTGKKQ